MQALCIYTGPRAMAHLARHGLQSADIAAIPAAAGGPKGLISGPEKDSKAQGSLVL